MTGRRTRTGCSPWWSKRPARAVLAEAEAGRAAEAQARHAFILAFQREPDRKEREAGAKLIREQGAKVFCRAIFNANEFIYVH